MNLYHCFIDIKHEAKALAFAQALDAWLSRLKDGKVIADWRLLRLKLNLASEGHSDFMLEIEVEDLAQLDRAFRYIGRREDEIETLHQRVSSMIAKTRFALYRPYPDPERAERIALL